MNPARYLLVLVAITVAGGAFGQTIYKLIDKNGKVTYSEKAPPKDYDGKVVPITVDSKANSATLRPGSGEGGARGGTGAYTPTEFEQQMIQRGEKRKRAEERVVAARKALEDARKALDEAKSNPEEGDVVWQSSVSEARPGPTPPKPSPQAAGPSSPLPGAQMAPSGPGPARTRTGARPTMTEAYAKRIASLEAAVKRAEEELEKAERELT